ncbi:MAG TPA: outer membrane beta-barrel protein [Candidatus Angelobacter sp.]|nr:outer membrane beta-barrel protein [Candidatus Angelobacter sp.]
MKAFAQSVPPEQKLVADSSAGSDVHAAGGSNANNGNNANADLLKELQQMRARIEQLETQLKAQSGATPESSSTQPAATVQSVSLTTTAHASPSQEQVKPENVEPAEPFAFADFTWLTGNPRTKTPAFDSKFFTPEIRGDIAYIYDFNHPADDTIGGSSEVFRSQEFQLTQLGVGGDFHFDNVHARLMTQFGMYSQTQPRNDASPARGQWSLADAYRYLSEAYAGYHFNALHGVNIDAGIFMSYIGLFSFYNFDNWAYQPSYVSSNTPWFFNGLRIQVFPTDKLKIEPWIINGWQSYGRFNHRLGLGGQVLWRPTGWLSVVGNQYGLGRDTLGVVGRTRFHTDDSIQVKYYDHPERGLDKMAFTLTADAGCESGGGVNCFGDSKTGVKQSFLGFMAYNRFWFHKDLFAATFGGGRINNPGRYLVLLPPIDGATAFTGTPYFTENPGDPFKAWDTTATFDYMPSQYITFRWEYNYRHANVPYFSGSGGITPAGGNNGNPGVLTPGFTPDLRKSEARLNLGLMVKF